MRIEQRRIDGDLPTKSELVLPGQQFSSSQSDISVSIDLDLNEPKRSAAKNRQVSPSVRRTVIWAWICCIWRMVASRAASNSLRFVFNCSRASESFTTAQTKRRDEFSSRWERKTIPSRASFSSTCSSSAFRRASSRASFCKRSISLAASLKGEKAADCSSVDHDRSLSSVEGGIDARTRLSSSSGDHWPRDLIRFNPLKSIHHRSFDRSKRRAKHKIVQSQHEGNAHARRSIHQWPLSSAIASIASLDDTGCSIVSVKGTTDELTRLEDPLSLSVRVWSECKALEYTTMMFTCASLQRWLHIDHQYEHNSNPVKKSYNLCLSRSSRVFSLWMINCSKNSIERTKRSTYSCCFFFSLMVWRVRWPR